MADHVASTTPAVTIGTSAATLATAMGLAATQLDGAMLNVALVAVGRSLDADVGRLQWLVNAYSITFVGLLVASGALADRIGARRVFRWGFVLFGGAAAIAAAAPGFGALVAARVVQGAGAAMLVPSSLALINHACRGDPAARVRAVGTWAVAGGMAAALGPAISGVVVGHAGWRAVFLVSAAVAVAGLAMTGPADGDTDRADTRRGFDWAGQLLATAALGASVAAVAAAGSGHRLWSGAAMAAAAAAAAAFVAVEKRAAFPIVPPAVLHDRGVGGVMAAGFAISFAVFGLVFGLAFYFQDARGYGPVETGSAFVPFSLAIIAGNMAGGRLGAAFGAGRVLCAGLLVAAGGTAMLAVVLDGSLTYAGELPAQIVARLGIGMAVPTATTLLLASVPPAFAGAASGAFTAFRQAGAAMGVATFAALTAADRVAGLRSALAISAALLAAAALAASGGLRRKGARG
ncbi:MAG: MFS transporter [Alphaproteobacteria bacterium]